MHYKRVGDLGLLLRRSCVGGFLNLLVEPLLEGFTLLGPELLIPTNKENTILHASSFGFRGGSGCCTSGTATAVDLQRLSNIEVSPRRNSKDLGHRVVHAELIRTKLASHSHEADAFFALWDPAAL